MTAAGELKIQAVADLGGLGAKEGAPVTYNWMLPNLIRPILSWAVVLSLLLLKPNRSCQASWIVLPMAILAGSAQTLLGLTPLGSDGSDFMLEGINAIVFGLAAVWLLAPFLARKHRFVTFLCFLPVTAIFSALTFAIRQDWSEGEPIMLVQIAVFLVLGVVVVALALFLTGLVCRRSYRPLAISLWLLAMMVGLWFLIAAPIFAIGTIASGGDAPWLEFCGGLLLIAGICFVIVLPFLLLSFFNTLYRDRLKSLLHLAMAVPPAPLAEPPLVQPAVQG